MKNRKICFYPGDLNPGGIGHLMINLAHEFIKRDFEVHFFLTTRRGLIEDELPKKAVIFRSGNSVKSNFSGLIKYIKREAPECVISARDNSNVVNILACLFTKTKTKAIASVHVDYTAVKQQHSFGTKIYRLFVFLLGLIFYRFADEIIAVSKGVADNHAKRFFLKRRKITVIYNPTFTSMDNMDDSEAVEYTGRLERPIIVSVGRLTTQKGFNVLIEAFSIYKKNNSGSLLILGEGEDRSKLERLVMKLNLQESVFMPGYVRSPALYIKSGDLFVCASLWEGFGNVIVEALGVGSKVVSTDCKSGPSEILSNGKYGILVPVNSADALAGGIEKQLDANIESSKQIDRAKDFSVPKIADEYLSLIN